MITEPRSTALVIGAKGLGRFVARHLAAQGLRVVCAARTRADVASLAAEVDAAGGEGVAFPADLQDEASVRALAAEAGRGGRLELVVAAQTSGAPFRALPVLELPDEAVAKGFAGYALGTLHLLRALGPLLQAQGSGTFVQLGTGAGTRAREGFTHLAMAQHALRVLVLGAAREWKAHGVHVVYLAAEGQLDTPASAGWIARAGRERALPPEEVCRALDYLRRQAPRAWTHELSLRPAASDWPG